MSIKTHYINKQEAPAVARELAELGYKITPVDVTGYVANVLQFLEPGQRSDDEAILAAIGRAVAVAPTTGARKAQGARLRQLREARGLTQEQMAGRLGAHQGHISGYESGERDLGLHMARRYAIALDCALSEVLIG
jgi:DNA-binding XRE family transcriptional regulator